MYQGLSHSPTPPVSIHSGLGTLTNETNPTLLGHCCPLNNSGFQTQLTTILGPPLMTGLTARNG